MMVLMVLGFKDKVRIKPGIISMFSNFWSSYYQIIYSLKSEGSGSNLHVS